MAEPLPSRRARAVVAAVLGWHLLCAVADVLEKLPVPALQPAADALGAVTGPYQSLVGFRQVWTMFSPSPPTNSRGLRVSVMGADGRWRVLVQPGLPDDGAVGLAYRRLGKFERNLVKKSAGAADAREALARTLCRAGADGEPVVGVRIDRVEKDTPAPGQPPTGWFETRQLERWCT